MFCVVLRLSVWKSADEKAEAEREKQVKALAKVSAYAVSAEVAKKLAGADGANKILSRKG